MAKRSNHVDPAVASQSGARRPEPDSFDKVQRSRRVGVHRKPRKRGAGWMRLLWIILATAVLSAIGIILVVIGPENLLLPQGGTSQEAVVEEEEQVTPRVDPETTVTILNGTSTAGLGDEVATIITEDELGTVEFVGNAADQSAKISAIFFSKPEDEALALGLGQKLGGISPYLREEYASYGTQLIVLIGADYKSTGRVSAEVPGDTDGSLETE